MNEPSDSRFGNGDELCAHSLRFCLGEGSNLFFLDSLGTFGVCFVRPLCARPL